MPHFEGASGFTIRNSVFIDFIHRDVSPKPLCSAAGDEEWRKSLTEASLFDAAHDSAALENLDPPFPTTQHKNLVEELDDLINVEESSVGVLMFSGPKSNLAHLCAKMLENILCASFIISHSLQTTNHIRFFPTIARQLSLHFPEYEALLKKELQHDPSILLHKSLEVQFKKLIFDPFRELLTKGHNFEQQRRVIVIDGLEEYAKVQIRLTILRIILNRAGELPFIWLIFDRPDKALDKLLVERGSATRIHWGKGFPALDTRIYSTGSIHSFLLVRNKSRSTVKRGPARANGSKPAISGQPLKSTRNGNTQKETTDMKEQNWSQNADPYRATIAFNYNCMEEERMEEIVAPYWQLPLTHTNEIGTMAIFVDVSTQEMEHGHIFMSLPPIPSLEDACSRMGWAILGD